MQNNSQEFSLQDILKLAKSPAGQQLMALINQTDPNTLNQALQQAASGDYTQARQTLSSLLGSEQAQRFLRQLEE